MSEETRRLRIAARLLIVSLAAGVPGCGSEDRDWRELDTLPFDDGTLAFEWLPDAGAGRLRIRHVDRSADQVVYEGRIENNGAPVTMENLRPQTDRPPELSLCLNGSDQEDLIVRINVRTGTTVRLERRCVP